MLLTPLNPSAYMVAPCAADSSRRAFYREFVKVVEASDVIIEVLDARDPLAYRSLDVERYVRAAGSDKKIILLLNKIGEDTISRAAVHLAACKLQMEFCRAWCCQAGLLASQLLLLFKTRGTL